MKPDTDYAWAAGFLDGEGYFGLEKPGQCSPHNTYVRSVRIIAGQKRRAPLDRLQQLLGGSINIQYRKTGIMYIWAVNNGAKMIEILPLILPHMTVKKQEAEALLEYSYAIGKSMRRYSPLDTTMIKRRKKITAKHEEARIYE